LWLAVISGKETNPLPQAPITDALTISSLVARQNSDRLGIVATKGVLSFPFLRFPMELEFHSAVLFFPGRPTVSTRCSRRFRNRLAI
jgi:hypothetical protein